MRSLECPVCDNELIRKTVGGIAVDACEGGCGGIWFDRYELMRVEVGRRVGGGSVCSRSNETRTSK